MEEKVFPDPAVAEILSEKFIEARIHTDHDELGEANRARQLEMTNSVAQPIYLLLDPENKEAERLRRKAHDDEKKAAQKMFSKMFA